MYIYGKSRRRGEGVDAIFVVYIVFYGIKNARARREKNGDRTTAIIAFTRERSSRGRGTAVGGGGGGHTVASERASE